MSRPTIQMRQQLEQQNAPMVQQIKTYYAYNLLFSSVANGATASANVQIQSDAAFLVQALSFFCYDLTTNAQITAPITQITLSGSGTTFFDQAIPILNAFGTAQLPFIMPEARLLPMNSNVNATLVNIVSTNSQYYMLTLHGKKVFKVNA